MIPSDRHHLDSAALFERHSEEQILTSNHVRGEAWTFVRRRAGHRTAVLFLDRLDRSPRVRVARVPEEMEEQALRWLRRHDEREYSFVDATSFVLMKTSRI